MSRDVEREAEQGKDMRAEEVEHKADQKGGKTCLAGGAALFLRGVVGCGADKGAQDGGRRHQGKELDAGTEKASGFLHDVMIRC